MILTILNQSDKHGIEILRHHTKAVKFISGQFHLLCLFIDKMF